MKNELLEQFPTQSNPLYGREFTRLWLRWKYNKQGKLVKGYTVAVKNNVIVDNYETRAEAKAVFDELQREFYRKAATK